MLKPPVFATLFSERLEDGRASGYFSRAFAAGLLRDARRAGREVAISRDGLKLDSVYSGDSGVKGESWVIRVLASPRRVRRCSIVLPLVQMGGAQ